MRQLQIPPLKDLHHAALVIRTVVGELATELDKLKGTKGPVQPQADIQMSSQTVRGLGVPVDAEDAVRLADLESLRDELVAQIRSTPAATQQITGTGTSSVSGQRGVGGWYGPLDLVGTKNGTNKVFTSPVVWVKDPNMRPIGAIQWRGAVLQYTTATTPGGMQWTLRGSGTEQEIVLGLAPQSVDSLGSLFCLAL